MGKKIYVRICDMGGILVEEEKRNNRFLSHSNGLVVTVPWDPDIRFQLNVPV